MAIHLPLLRNPFAPSSSLDKYFLNWVGIAVARWEKTLFTCDGLSVDGIETLSIFISVTECYSESEQEDPDVAVETAHPPHSAGTLSPLVCTDTISLLFIDQMRGHHSFQMG